MRVKKLRTHDYIQVDHLSLKDASEEGKRIFRDGTVQQLVNFDATMTAPGVVIALSETDEILIPWPNIKEIIRVKDPAKK